VGQDSAGSGGSLTLTTRDDYHFVCGGAAADEVSILLYLTTSVPGFDDVLSALVFHARGEVEARTGPRRIGERQPPTRISKAAREGSP
jgi:hypothetical protein